MQVATRAGLCVVLVWALNAQADPDTALCVEDQATGFKMNRATSAWKQTAFHPDSKFLFTRKYRPSWEVRRLGLKNPVASQCTEELGELGRIFRNYGDVTFRLDQTTNIQLRGRLLESGHG